MALAEAKRERKRAAIFMVNKLQKVLETLGKSEFCSCWWWWWWRKDQRKDPKTLFTRVEAYVNLVLRNHAVDE